MDFDSEGQINYTKFLAATVNKEKAFSLTNLRMAFNHFDVDGSNFITV